MTGVSPPLHRVRLPSRDRLAALCKIGFHLPVFVALAATPTAKAEPAGAVGPNPSAETMPSYTSADAQQDVDVVLRDRGRGYLDARARLESRAAVAVPVLRARLAGPLSDPERHRLLNVLGSYRRPEDLTLFAEALVASTKTSPSSSAAFGIGPSDGAPAYRVLMEPWRTLILDQGAVATPIIAELVNNRELATEVREQLLEDLVTLLPLDGVLGLVDTIGRGDPPLEAALRRALADRARRIPADGEQLLTQVSAAQVAEPDATRAAVLLYVEAALTPSEDTRFLARLTQLLASPSERFEVRIAAIRVLHERPEYAEGLAALRRVAHNELSAGRRTNQASEILGWLAASGLPPQHAQALADELDLAAAEQPRLAEFGLRYATLVPNGDWLGVALADPWPSVRRAGLARVAGPCTERTLSQLSDATERWHGDELPVAQSALAAVGRCGGQPALELAERTLDDASLDVSLRATAALAVLELAGPTAARRLADRLSKTDDEELAAVLVEAIHHAPSVDPSIQTTICAAARTHPRLAPLVRRTLQARFDRTDCG